MRRLSTNKPKNAARQEPQTNYQVSSPKKRDKFCVPLSSRINCSELHCVQSKYFAKKTISKTNKRKRIESTFCFYDLRLSFLAACDL